MHMRNFINLIEGAVRLSSSSSSSSRETLLEVVLFTPAENVLAPYLEELRDPNVRTWFLTVFKNWVMKQPGELLQLPYLPPTANDKQTKAFSFHDLWDMRLTTKTQTVIGHLIDFFNANPGLQRLERMSVENAEHAAELWVKTMNKKAAKLPDDPKEVKTLMTYPNGFSMVELVGENALAKEGQRMGHCVGSYCDYVISGKTRIFSLRDQKHEPHATIELTTDRNAINQIKGRQNRAPVKRYWAMIRQFLESIAATIQRDYKNVGLLQIYDDETGATTTITQDQFRDMILDPNDARGQRIMSNAANLRNMDEDSILGLFVSLYGTPRLTNAMVTAAFTNSPSLAVQHVAATGGDKFTPEQLSLALELLSESDTETIREFLRVTKPNEMIVKGVIDDIMQQQAANSRNRNFGNNTFVLAIAQELPQVYSSLLDTDATFLQNELEGRGLRAAGPFFVYAGTDKLTPLMINRAFAVAPEDAMKRVLKINLSLEGEAAAEAIEGLLSYQYREVDSERVRVLNTLVEYVKPDATIIETVMSVIDGKGSIVALLTAARKHVPDQVSQEVTEEALLKLNEVSQFKKYLEDEPRPSMKFQQALFDREPKYLQYVQIIDPSLWPQVMEELRPAPVEQFEIKKIGKVGRDGKPIYTQTNGGYKQQATYDKKVSLEPTEIAKRQNEQRRIAQREFLTALDPLLRSPAQTDDDQLDPASPKMVAAQRAFEAIDKGALFNVAVKILNREADVTSVGGQGGWGERGFDRARFASLVKTLPIKDITGIINRGYDREPKFGIFMSSAPERMGEFLKYWYEKGNKTGYGRNVDPWDKFKMPMDKNDAFLALASVWESNASDGIKDRFATTVLKRFKPSPGNLLAMLKKANNGEVTDKILRKTAKPSPELIDWVITAFPALIDDSVPLAKIGDKSLTLIFKTNMPLAKKLIDRDIRDVGKDHKWDDAKVRKRQDRQSPEFLRYQAAAHAAGKDKEFERWAEQIDLDDTHEEHDDAAIAQNLQRYNGTTLIKLVHKKPDLLKTVFNTFDAKRVATLVSSGLLKSEESWQGYNKRVSKPPSVEGIPPEKLEQVARIIATDKKKNDHHERGGETLAKAIIDAKIPLNDPFITVLIPLAKSSSYSGGGHLETVLIRQLTTDEGKNWVADNDIGDMGYVKEPTAYMVKKLFDVYGIPDKSESRKEVPYFFSSIVQDWFREGPRYYGGHYVPNPTAAKLIKDEAIKRGGQYVQTAKAMFKQLANKRAESAAEQKRRTTDEKTADTDDDT
jgi:hypothetical protein